MPPNFRYLTLLLKPIARFCLRSSFSVQEVVTAFKQALVQVAKEEMERQGAKVNVSRISVVTGMYRAEVAKILEGTQEKASQPMGLIARVLNQWSYDPRYCSRPGSPKILSATGKGSQFYELVSGVSQHINPGTVLAELQRGNIVTPTARGVKLVRDIHRVGKDPDRGFNLLSNDLDTLISAVSENLLAPQAITNVHLSTSYDNIFRDELPIIRRWMLEEGKDLHRRTREFLSQFDKDISKRANSDKAEAGAKVTLVTVGLTDSLPTDFKVT